MKCSTSDGGSGGARHDSVLPSAKPTARRSELVPGLERYCRYLHVPSWILLRLRRHHQDHPLPGERVVASNSRLRTYVVSSAQTLIKILGWGIGRGADTSHNWGMHIFPLSLPTLLPLPPVLWGMHIFSVFPSLPYFPSRPMGYAYFFSLPPLLPLPPVL